MKFPAAALVVLTGASVVGAAVVAGAFVVVAAAEVVPPAAVVVAPSKTQSLHRWVPIGHNGPEFWLIVGLLPVMVSSTLKLAVSGTKLKQK